MKVRICYTIDVDVRFRQALRYRYGETGLATRKEIQVHCRDYGGTIDMDVLSEYDDRNTK